MTNGSSQSTCESNVQAWVKPRRSARRASSTTPAAGGFVWRTHADVHQRRLTAGSRSVARFRNWPWPARPVNVPASMTNEPRERTTSTPPSTSKPSHDEWSTFMWCGRVRDRLAAAAGRTRRCRRPSRGRRSPCAGTGRTSAPAWSSTSRPSARGQLAVDDALVDEVHPVLDPGHAVGDGPEVVDAELLLVLEAEGAVVGGHDREVVRAQAVPEVGVVVLVLGAQRRRAHPLGALEAGRAELVLEGQVQVLRAGLGEHVAAGVAGRAPPARAPRTPTGARCRAGRCRRRRPARSPGGWPRPRGPSGGRCRGARDRSRRARRPAAASTSMAMPFSACIMIVAPLFDGALHGPQDLGVVAVEDARVGHEQLEAGDALVVHAARPSPSAPRR